MRIAQKSRLTAVDYAEPEGLYETRTAPAEAPDRLGSMENVCQLRTSRDAPQVSSEPKSHGRARAMMVFSPVRPWHRRPGGVLWLRLVFMLGRTLPADEVAELSFIHFLQFAIIKRIPNFGQPRERLRQPLLMFESNYNGTFNQYIDAFSSSLTQRMKVFWNSSYGFPGPQPVTPFKSYIRGNEYPVSHYYSAYPSASTTMITSALALSRPLQEFGLRAATFTPERFADEYRGFLTRMEDRDARSRVASPVSRLAAARRIVRALVARPPRPGGGSRSGRSYVITLLMPITPGCEGALRAHLEGLDSDDSPLAKLPYVHFGRWAVIDQLKLGWEGAPGRPSRLNSQYLLFTASMTVPAEEEATREERYLERLPESFLHELRVRIPDEVDAIWRHCHGYPGSSNPDEFVRYLANGRLESSLVYVGYPDVTVDEVRQALAARDSLVTFARDHQGQRDAAELQRAYLKESSTWSPPSR
jgi:hypothetical protein